jgi:cobalt-zinc-cadmium efflux system protein
MMVSSWGLLREGFNLLLEAAPRHIEPEEVRSKLIHLMGVVEIHDLHIWQIASGQTALSAHLVMGAHAKSNELLKTATEMLVNQFKISHSTLQIELEGQIPSERCHDCDHR